MSLDPDSNAKEVYVRLLNEGTVVYRPVLAVLLSGDAARLVMPRDYDPEGEEWEFPPGSVVRTESRVLEGNRVLVAVAFAG